MTVTSEWLRSPELRHFGASRAGEAGDAIDGTVPQLVIQPAEPAAMAAALAWVSREKLLTVIRGRGTKVGWGRPPSRVDVVISTTRLNGGLVHRHGDLTATVQSGVTLTDLNRQLAAQGQWLPLDTPFDAATIGGLVATNDAGPLRHRYGTPRDLLIGITLALTDGTLIKAGGHVVKNVAGYDLAKLISGSFGTLAVIVDATFKLLPIARSSQTVVAEYVDLDLLAKDAATLACSQLEPTAFDVHMRTGETGAAARCTIAARFATSPDATTIQTNAARALLHGDSRVLADVPEAAWWSEQVRRPWAVPGTVVRVGWMPAALPEVLALVGDLGRSTGAAVELTGRAALGAGLLRFEANDAATATAIEQLRASHRLVTNITVLRQSRAMKRTVDPWGPAGSTAAVLSSLKRTFDPAGILNAGRGPI